MKDKNNLKVTKEHAEMFKEILGSNMQKGDFEIKNGNNGVKNVINNGDTPPLLKSIQIFFNYLTTFFTVVIPFGLVVSLCTTVDIRQNVPILDLLKVFGFSVAAFCGIKLVEFLVSCVIIYVYTKQLDKMVKQAELLQDAIKNKVDNGTKEEKPISAFEQAVDDIILFGIKNKFWSGGVDDIREVVRPIYYNIITNEDLKRKCNDDAFVNGVVSGDIKPAELFAHTEGIDETVKTQCFFGVVMAIRALPQSD